MGSQRSVSGEARLAMWAELTTRTAWNLWPTLGRGCTFRTPASSSAASTSRYAVPPRTRRAPPSRSRSRGALSPVEGGPAGRPLRGAGRGLDLGLESHHPRVEGRLVGRDRPEPGEEA